MTIWHHSVYQGRQDCHPSFYLLPTLSHYGWSPYLGKSHRSSCLQYHCPSFNPFRKCWSSWSNKNLTPHVTSWSKHYQSKTIWFWKKIAKHMIKLLKNHSTDQFGDLFTKELTKLGNWTPNKEIHVVVILCCINAWKGELIFSFDLVCFVNICKKKGRLAVINSAKVGMIFYLSGIDSHTTINSQKIDSYILEANSCNQLTLLLIPNGIPEILRLNSWF